MLSTKKHNGTESQNKTAHEDTNMVPLGKHKLSNKIFVPNQPIKQAESDDFSVSMNNVASKGLFTHQHNPETNKVNLQMEKVGELIRSEKKKVIDPPQVIEKKIMYTVVNPDDPSTIMVTFNNQTFSFYNNKKSHLGNFAINQLIKYVVSDPTFMPDIAMGTADTVIETFICTNKDGKLRLYDHIASIFMGNLEMLVRLNNAMYDFEKKNTELTESKYLAKIKAFNFTLLNHTLKIISTISSEHKSNSNMEIKQKLMKYSIGIIYRMITYIRERLTSNIENTSIINANIDKLVQTRTDISRQMEKLTSAIIHQNNTLNIIIEKLDSTEINYKQEGGNNKSSESSSISSSTELNDGEYIVTADENELTTTGLLNNSSDEDQINSLTNSDDSLTVENNFDSNPSINSSSSSGKQLQTSNSINTSSNYSQMDGLSDS